MLWLIILIAFSLPWNDLANNFDGFSSGCQTNYPSSTISRIPFLKPTPPAEIVPALLFAPFLPAPVAPVLLSSPPAAGPVASLAAPAVQWFMIHVNNCLFREGRELWKLENNKSLGGYHGSSSHFRIVFLMSKLVKEPASKFSISMSPAIRWVLCSLPCCLRHLWSSRLIFFLDQGDGKSTCKPKKFQHF